VDFLCNNMLAGDVVFNLIEDSIWAEEFGGEFGSAK
jgi:hypothetical protein